MTDQISHPATHSDLGPHGEPGARIKDLLEELYPGRGDEVADRLAGLLEHHQRSSDRARRRPGASSVVLITYADQFRAEGEAPLATLRRFCREQVPFIPTVHLLPFFPYSSDDGFSVIDYLQVDPRCGTWQDVAALAEDVDIMFDAVINHISAHSAWFKAYLAGEAPFQELAIEVAPGEDLREVVRPRALPLLTTFETAEGPKQLWTTFSEDQVDLNFAAPETLLQILEVLLSYVDRGASLIRLDAIAFAWKQIGTSCMSLPNTHRLVQLMRAVLDLAAPRVSLITETNVPHEENISYFGDGHDEAQLVYNFALPPLVLHTLSIGNATALSRWAAELVTPSDDTWFFNFLASHDGIGMRGVETILTPEERSALAERAEAHGGFVGYRDLPDGSKTPYELNINYFDALSDPQANESEQLQVDRFVCAHSIQMTLPGVPGLYVHSLVGSRGDRDSVLRTGINRAINRAKLDFTELTHELEDPASLRARVFTALRSLIEHRGQLPQLEPGAAHEVLEADPRLFVVRRGDSLVCVHNISGQPVEISWAGIDQLSGREVLAGEQLGAYGVVWVQQ